MTSSIDRAKELLEVVAGQSPDCTCPTPKTFHKEGCPWVLWIRASIAAESKVQIQALDLLRGYIGTIAVLQEQPCRGVYDPDPCRVVACTLQLRCGRCAAVEEFDKLFPEEVD